MSEPAPSLLTVREAAQRLSLSEASIYEMVRSGQLRAIRLGRRAGAIRIRPEDLEHCLQANSQQFIENTPAPRMPRVKLKHIRLR